MPKLPKCRIPVRFRRQHDEEICSTPLAFIALSTGNRRELNKFTRNTDTDFLFVCACSRVCVCVEFNRPTRRPNGHRRRHTHDPIRRRNVKTSGKSIFYGMSEIWIRWTLCLHRSCIVSKWIRNLCFGDKNNRRKYVFVHFEFLKLLNEAMMAGPGNTCRWRQQQPQNGQPKGKKTQTQKSKIRKLYL